MKTERGVAFGIWSGLVYLLRVKSWESTLRKVGSVIRIPSQLILLLWIAIFLPAAAQSQVVLNEIMANNQSTLANGGDYPDWIELYNAADATANLGGMVLTNLGSTKFTFPKNTLLNGKSYLIVWCDSVDISPGLHTGFKLSATGEGVALYGSDGTRLDFVSFGLQVADFTIGRIPNGTGAWQLNVPTPALANEAQTLGSPAGLRMNEWMATNSMGDDWIELYNSSASPVSVAGMVFTDKLAVPPSNRAITNLSFIAADDFIQFFASSLRKKDADHLDFKLSHTSGETVSLYQADRVTLVDRISFSAGLLSRDTSQGRLPDGGATIVLFPVGKTTPGASNFLPLTNVVVNEVLSHTDLPMEDAIELLNVTPAPVDISNWWISNAKDTPKKYRVPPGTVIPGHSFKVFYEKDFNPNPVLDPLSFTLNSAHGDSVYLFTGNPAGELTGYRHSVTFDSAENGVSFGRYQTVSNGWQFVAMSRRTFGVDELPFSLEQFRTGTGRTNAYPKVGPLVINEIMYHPPDLGTNDNALDEYIEIYNMSGHPVNLYDPAATTNTWKLKDAVTFEFPRFVTVPVGGYVVVANFDPTNEVLRTAFCGKYKVPSGACVPNVTLFGPYQGKLKNSGASIALYKPDPPQVPPHPDAGFVPYILVDKVKYSDSAPWPTTPDGSGTALQRRKPEAFGNDVVNWMESAPTPGWHPIKIDSVARQGGFGYVLTFGGVAGSTYTVQYSGSLSSGTWSKLTDLGSQATTGSRQATDFNLDANPKRFYRIVAPVVP